MSEPATIVIRAADLQGEQTPSLAKASGSMAVATLISRVTGFGWRLALTVLLGITATQDAYNATGT